jgi:hypothetical protein
MERLIVARIALTPALSRREREQSLSGFALLSPFGRATEGEGILTAIAVFLWVLRQFQQWQP